MSDLIDRQAAIEAINKAFVRVFEEKLGESVLKDVPSAQSERKTGKWTKEIKHHKDQYQEFNYCEIRCSVCGGRPEKAWHLTRFCPNCGCAMELFKEETNESIH